MKVIAVWYYNDKVRKSSVSPLIMFSVQVYFPLVCMG